MDDLRPRQFAVMNRHDETGIPAFGQGHAGLTPQGMTPQGLTPQRARRPDADLRGADAAAPPARDDLVKAGIDRIAALLGLLLLLPLLLMVAALIWLRDPGPVLFAHPRVGRGGRMFRCLKFRTMVRNGDDVLARHLQASAEAAREWEETRKLRDDPRVTRLGRTLRKTSIDELPQLINVLKGEMSLVGPRPIVEAEARHYGTVMREYTSVRPGLTGLWQVGGRSDTTYAERVRLDQTYVRTRSLWLDTKIILRTILVVIKGRGSY